MPKIPLGPAVEAHRIRLALSQADLAGKAKIKIDTLRALEKGAGKARHLTVKSVAAALGTTPEALHAEALQISKAPRPETPTVALEVESSRLLARLRNASRLMANRTNVVRAERGVATLTLGENLYVRRNIQDGIINSLKFDPDATLIVVEGEPGTGKSSLLWSLYTELLSSGVDVWLIDAVELSAIFGPGHPDGSVLSDEFRVLFSRLLEAARPPTLLIDTADVVLNIRGRETHFEALIGELSLAGARTLVASRPGEARRLSIFEPYVVQLFDYSDDEFVAAVGTYARAYVREDTAVDAAQHAAALMEAVAQGYPIKEICRNPLTLRMLYSIYAPEQINVSDIDVVSLYRTYWARRVEADIRTDAVPAAAGDADLSLCAMRVATSMLVEGIPELSFDAVVQDLRSAGVSVVDLNQLLGRGVIRDTLVGNERFVTFFHQTFFEHAAAMALLRLTSSKGFAALAERWRANQGNLFLGAVLERALVLSEYEAYPVKQTSTPVMIDMSAQGPSGLSLLVYAFVHRRSVDPKIEELIRDRVRQGDALVIERFLGIAGNAPRYRRSVLISILGDVIGRKNSRWIRRALELLLRFSTPEIEAVAKVFFSANVSDIVATEGFPQARDLFLKFLARNFQRDPQWTLAQLVRHFGEALHRGSDATAVQVLEVICTACRGFPNLENIVEAAISDQRVGRTSGRVSELFGEIFYDGWRLDAVTPATLIQQIDEWKFKGLSLTARLNGLVNVLLDSTPDEVLDAFRLSATASDAATRVMLGRITWARFLPLMIERWPREVADKVTRKMRPLSKEALSESRSPEADIVFHALRAGPSRSLTHRLLARTALSDPKPWLQTTLLGRHLIQGVAQNISGARSAFATLVNDPTAHGELSRAALAQMRSANVESAELSIGLELASRTANAESSLGFLEKAAQARPEWNSLIPALRKIAGQLRANGNVRARRQAIRIELEMARLQMDASIRWEYLVQQAETERDDINRSFIIQTIGLLAESNPDHLSERLSWISIFSLDKGAETRKAALQIFDRVSNTRPAMVMPFIDHLFEMAFRDDPDGSIVTTLSNPVFALYQARDPRVFGFAELLIDRSASLKTQTCRRICGTFRRLFGMIMQRMTPADRGRLLDRVPGLNRYLARMIVEGIAISESVGLADQLQKVVENPRTDPEIVTLAGRFIRRELRVSGLDRWPELYMLMN